MQINRSNAHTQAALYDVQKTAIPQSSVVVEGKVIDIHPEDSTVDVVLYGGTILRHVRVLLSSANTVAGFRYLATVKNTNAAKQTQNGVVDKAVLTHEADTIATIVYVHGQTISPRVIGFTFPTDSQLHIDELGLALFRHESGVYSLIDKDGHHETHYPDGSYIIAGTDLTPKDMQSSKNAQDWSIPDAPNIDMKIHLAQGVDIIIKDNKITLSAGSAYINVDGTSGTVTAKGASNPEVTIAT